MNHPKRDPVREMEWMHGQGLGFIDLTLEPPMAASWRVNTGALRAAMERFGLGVVGHTAFYLPVASPVDDLREGAVSELRRCLGVFASLGARWMNVHPDPDMHFHSREAMLERNRLTLRELLDAAAQHGIGLMIENIPGKFNNVEQLAPLLDPLPELGLHLDIGHANLRTNINTTGELVARYSDRIRHVHLHDNKGGNADLHLPLGAGTLDSRSALTALKRAGYDGTITLEVFCDDLHFFSYSRDALQEIWNSIE